MPSKAKALVARLARDFPRQHEPCPVGSDRVLDTALITAPEARDPKLLAETRRRRRTGAEVMKVDGRHFRSIWLEPDGWSVGAIDQRRLPHEFVIARLETADAAADAIRSMLVRGAPLIGATAAYGMALAVRDDRSDDGIDRAYELLIATRPTAINLKWALDEMKRALRPAAPSERAQIAYARAAEIAEEDVAINREIGRHGLALIEQIAAAKPPGEPVNVLTHCNAGWLATVDWGTATAPIYLGARSWPEGSCVGRRDPAAQSGRFADGVGTRSPRRARTRSFADNTGGHLMQHRMVDLAIVGTDRVTANGDVCNKIGTYLKALAAHDNGVPFYVALPSPTIDFSIETASARFRSSSAAPRRSRP